MIVDFPQDLVDGHWKEAVCEPSLVIPLDAATEEHFDSSKEEILDYILRQNFHSRPLSLPPLTANISKSRQGKPKSPLMQLKRQDFQQYKDKKLQERALQLKIEQFLPDDEPEEDKELNTYRIKGNAEEMALQFAREEEMERLYDQRLLEESEKEKQLRLEILQVDARIEDHQEKAAAAYQAWETEQSHRFLNVPSMSPVASSEPESATTAPSESGLSAAWNHIDPPFSLLLQHLGPSQSVSQLAPKDLIEELFEYHRAMTALTPDSNNRRLPPYSYSEDIIAAVRDRQRKKREKELADRTAAKLALILGQTADFLSSPTDQPQVDVQPTGMGAVTAGDAEARHATRRVPKRTKLRREKIAELLEIAASEEAEALSKNRVCDAQTRSLLDLFKLHGVYDKTDFLLPQLIAKPRRGAGLRAAGLKSARSDTGDSVPGALDSTIESGASSESVDDIFSQYEHHEHLPSPQAMLEAFPRRLRMRQRAQHI